MRTIQQLLTDHLDIWTAAEIEKNQVVVVVVLILLIYMV